MTPGPLVLTDAQGPTLRPGELLRLARRRVSRLVPPNFPLDDALIALEEAYTNVLEHAFGPTETPKVRIEGFWDLKGLTFVMIDRGELGGKLRLPQQPTVPVSALRQRAVSTGGSLGLYLLRRVMNCLCYDVSSRGVNRLTMTKFPHQEKPMEEELIMELRTDLEVGRVILKGFVNMDTSDFLAERLTEFVEREQVHRLLIDARDLEYVSSAGVGVFIDLYDRLEDRGGKIAFWSLKAPVRRVLNLVGFMGFFGDFEDEASALAHLMPI